MDPGGKTRVSVAQHDPGEQGSKPVPRTNMVSTSSIVSPSMILQTRISETVRGQPCKRKDGRQSRQHDQENKDPKPWLGIRARR